jgi:hypothetical protein
LYKDYRNKHFRAVYVQNKMKMGNLSEETVQDLEEEE